MRISRLQEQYPRSIGQGIGRHLDVDATKAQVWHENRHNPIQVQIGRVWLATLREAIPSDHSYCFLIHDRDSIFSAEMDQQLKAFGLRVLHTPADTKGERLL